MTGVWTFVIAHWKGLVLGTGGVVLGAYLGRLTAPKPICPPSPPCPELHCAAQVDAGVNTQVECKSKVVVHYVTTDAGCPEPVVSVDTSGNASGTASTTSGATASATQPPEVHVVPIYVPGPSWEVSGGAGVTLEGRLAVPVGVRWYPKGGVLGLGVEGDVRPHDVKQSSVGLSVTGRW